MSLNVRRIFSAYSPWETGMAARMRCAERRTHFHIPVFLDDLGTSGTTRFALEQALAKHRETPLTSRPATSSSTSAGRSP